MFMTRLWNRLNTYARPVQAGQGIYSTEEFRLLLEYERARVDRNGHEFSLIVFDVGEAESKHTHNGQLMLMLARRVRCTDLIGWFEERCIGVFLPDTPAEGAWKLAHDLCQLIDLPMRSLAFKVYTYPSERYHHAS